MRIEFDPAKDARNLAKHGVSLALAESLEWDLLLAMEDTRESYGEVAMAKFAWWALLRSVGQSIAWSLRRNAKLIGLSACERRCRRRRERMQVKSKSGRIFDLPSPEEEAEIRAGIFADPDARELSDVEIRKLRPIGRPKAAVTKQPVSIRLSPEVLEFFKSTGKGWQTRVDEVLKEYVESHR